MDLDLTIPGNYISHTLISTTQTSKFLQVLRELEDIAEQTKVPVVSVRRQFHNLKRIVAFMEQTYAVDKDTARLSRGSPSQISILEAIGNDFLLPVELASQ